MLYGVPFMFYDAHGPSLPLCGGVWRWYSRGDDVWRVGGWRAEVKGRGNGGVCTCQRAVSFPVFRMAIEVYRSAYMAAATALPTRERKHQLGQRSNSQNKNQHVQSVHTLTGCSLDSV